MRNAFRAWRALFAAALAVAALAARAQDDPPGRVGSIADLQGSVRFLDDASGEWTAAQRNWPLTRGDRVATDAGGRAELRIGSTTLRLGADSELDLRRIDDERVVVELHHGKLALRVRSREVAAETEVVTAEARMRPQRSGHYRIERVDDTTLASAWRGELRITDDAGSDEAFVIDNGRRAELWLEGPQRRLRHEWSSIVDDDFGSWALREDERDERVAEANRYVSPEMTGAGELDRYGRWETHPEYGAIWLPTAVAPDWAPYRDGRWAWVEPWGWTWIDDAPWGFAPFHYGRWLSWRGRWCWAPGGYVARPVYAPALVAWIGAPGVGVSIAIGGAPVPAVGWVPLAPTEVFVPYYRASPDYHRRVNHRPPGPPLRPVPTGPVMYTNQGVPGGVSVVPRDVLARHLPVARAVIEVREPLAPAAPPTYAPRQRPPPGAVPVMPGVPSPSTPRQPPHAPPRPVPQQPPQQPPQGAPSSPAQPAPRPQPIVTPAPMPAPVAVPPAVVDLRRAHDEARTPAPRPVPPQPAPRAPVTTAPPAVAPAVPTAPPPQIAPPRPPDKVEKPERNEEPRQKTPESRSGMRERQQIQ